MAGTEVTDTRDEPDVLRTPEAGRKVIRGGGIRSGGYAAGGLRGALASVFLLRHLGVVGFGEYVTVMALVAIVSGITDAGLTVVGSRELAIRRPGAARQRLVASVVGLRVVLTVVGIAGAVAFAAI